MNEGTLYHFEAFLTDKEFKLGGYMEIQKDKTNFFKWQVI